MRAGEKERDAISEGCRLHRGKGEVASKGSINVDSHGEPDIDIGRNILDRLSLASYSIHMERRQQQLKISDVVDARVALRVLAWWRTAPLIASQQGDSTEWEAFPVETFKSNRFVGG